MYSSCRPLFLSVEIYLLDELLLHATARMLNTHYLILKGTLSRKRYSNICFHLKFTVREPLKKNYLERSTLLLPHHTHAHIFPRFTLQTQANSEFLIQSATLHTKLIVGCTDKQQALFNKGMQFCFQKELPRSNE